MQGYNRAPLPDRPTVTAEVLFVQFVFVIGFISILFKSLELFVFIFNPNIEQSHYEQ